MSKNLINPIKPELEMKRLFLFLLAALLLMPAAAKTKKVVYIIIDGVPADMIERLELPAIREIGQTGSYVRLYTGGEVGGYTQTPTISAVGYTNILTGCWACKHNVWDNAPKPNYNYWTLFRIAEEQKRDVKTALYSGWTDNRTVLIGEGKPETGGLKLDYVADGYDLDTVNFPREKDELQIFKIDEKVTDEAAEGIRTDAPDLSWVYLWYTDDAGHFYGNSEFFDRYTRKADDQVRRIWEAVKYREANFDEEWMVIVTTDHGRDDSGYNHGGQSARERSSWMATNVKINESLAGQTDLALTDIAPTICRFLDFDVPRDVQWEQDGIPFIGQTDLVELRSKIDGGTIELSWKSLNDKARATVYVAPSNNYRTGGKDEWVRVGKVKVGDEVFRFDTAGMPSDFYKFVIETPGNHLNRWVELPK